MLAPSALRVLRAMLLVVTVFLAPIGMAHDTQGTQERLPTLGTAADFRLTTQDGGSLSLGNLRGKVVVISFIYTHCTDTCPLLVANLVTIQKALGNAFGTDVFFLSITVDPENDRPEVLKRYAEALGCDLKGWAFLTGTPEQIRQVARDYGVYHQERSDGSVDHNLLTGLVDRGGHLRVQYMGERFKPGEFLHDLKLLATPVVSR